MSPPEEEVLVGGNMAKVVRVGATVRRSAGAWTPAVHALLDYLGTSGFDAAPVPLGMDDSGREVLSYIEGATVMTPVNDQVWFDTMADAARLMRRFHDLSTAFKVSEGLVWRDHPAEAGEPEVICHSDWAPYNAVWREGRLVGIIDWDVARPGSRFYDLAWFAIMWCPLVPPEKFTAHLAQPLDQPRRLRQVCDAYGLEDRSGLLEAIWAGVEPSISWIEDGAAAGDPAHVKMAAEGHAANLG
jgi:hypothetical protein